MHSRGQNEIFGWALPDPVSLGLSAATLASISTTASVVGGVTSAVGAVGAGVAGYSAYSYKSQVAANNAQIAKNNAAYAMAVGEFDAKKQGVADAFKMGQITTAQAASGFDINSGTALGVRQSQAAANKTNQNVIRANAKRQAYGFEVEAMNYEAESKIDTMAGTNSLISGAIGGAGSLVGTAGTVSDKWLSYAKAGVPGYEGLLG